MKRYRVITRKGSGVLQARRKPFLFIFRRWQPIAIGPAEDLQPICTRLNRSLEPTPVIPATGTPPYTLP
jgi:hypothetical protein